MSTWTDDPVDDPCPRCGYYGTNVAQGNPHAEDCPLAGVRS